MSATERFIVSIECGTSIKRCTGSLAIGWTPTRLWACLEMRITPIAASIPCTTADGKTSQSFPTLLRASII